MRITTDAWLVDTNVLLPWANADIANHALAFETVRRIVEVGGGVCVAAQNLVEFWNTATRPEDRNGYGFTPAEADAIVRRVESFFHRLPDKDAVYSEWRRIVLDHRVSGVQVHDARLAAFMRVHGVENILTFNTRHFRRYDFLTAASPRDVLAG